MSVRCGSRAWWLHGRGTNLANISMTPVDQAGNKVAGYRYGRLQMKAMGTTRSVADPDTVEIIVHPSQQLTEELCLALALLAPRPVSAFEYDGGGGG